MCGRTGRAGSAIHQPAHQPCPLRVQSLGSDLPLPCVLELPFWPSAAGRLFYGLEEVMISFPLPALSNHLALSQRRLFPLICSFLYEPFCINYFYLILFPTLLGQVPGPLGQGGTGLFLLPQPGVEVLGHCTATTSGSLAPPRIRRLKPGPPGAPFLPCFLAPEC